MLKYEMLKSILPASEFDIKVVTFYTDYDIPDVLIVRGVGDVLESPYFSKAVLLLYEFGIFYDLFNSVLLAPPGATSVAVWHNITPLEFAETEHDRNVISRSLDQRGNLALCDHIFSDSAFNAKELEVLGVPAYKCSVLDLPVHRDFLEFPEGAPRQGGINLLFVGRFVRSKGVIELVQAVGRILSDRSFDVTIHLVGNERHSDPAYIARLHETIAAYGLQERIRFLGTVPHHDLVQLFHGMDLFVIPSYHEGYCVPVLEAFSAGCHVIAYDAGNLPAITGGLGAVVPTGDVAALASAIEGYCEAVLRQRHEGTPAVIRLPAGDLLEEERRRRVRRYAAQFNEDRYKAEFLARMKTVAMPVFQRRGAA